jgi:hypothetical protein
MKRVISAILVIAAFSTTAFAKYSGGSGEPNDPYQIADVNDLLTLANDINDYNKCFIQTADIDLDPNLPGNQVFTTAVIARDKNNANSIFDGNSFSGIFDGADHEIINLKIDTNGVVNDYLGLFGDINGGEIKNLCLKNISVTGKLGEMHITDSEYLGSLAGYNKGTIRDCCSTANVSNGVSSGGLAGGNSGNIMNCYSTGTVSVPILTAGIGGLVGSSEGSISNCYSTANVSGGYFIGGLVGYNKGTISNSYSTGTITGWNMAQYIGGLVGENRDGNIIDCYSISAVNGLYRAYYLGGLVGRNYGGNINGCFAMGDVSGDEETVQLGGLTGYNDGNISDCYSTGTVYGNTGSSTLGGLVGSNSGPLYHCYATGNVYGASPKGGLVGINDGNIISNCYFYDRSGLNNGYGTPLTDTQMKQQVSFVGWDFINVWFINEGFNCPQLRQSGPIPKYPGGSGTPEDPYQIATKSDLLDLSANIADYWKYFILTEDIHLNAFVLQNAVIAADNSEGLCVPFTGTFDGNGHKITHFSISLYNGEHLGLFGLIGSGGSVKNLGLEKFSLYEYAFGSFYPSTGGLAGYNFGNISNCYSTGTVSKGGGPGCVGGMVGCNSGSISNCYSTGPVSGNFYSGGFCGYNSSYGMISKCYSTGPVNGGGFCGSNNGSIIDCFWDINTSGTATSSGGTGLTTVQMQMQSTFTDAGWDFINIWHICESTNYPKLIWQILTSDFVCPDGVSFADFSFFAQRWLDTNCASNNDCDGTDFDLSGTVDWYDLDAFVENWLLGL